jgi:hypothetical protein
LPLFSLSWSHYVRLLSVTDLNARRHYEDEALCGGWSVRQLDRQISTPSFQQSRTGHLKHGSKENTPDSEIKYPLSICSRISRDDSLQAFSFISPFHALAGARFRSWTWTGPLGRSLHLRPIPDCCFGKDHIKGSLEEAARLERSSVRPYTFENKRLILKSLT